MAEFKDTGLSSEDLFNIGSIFRKNSKVTKVILFGSRAKGTFSNGSDIDLALEGENLGLTDILDFSIELDSLCLPYKFDVILSERIKEVDLLDHIARVGINILDYGI